MAQRYRIDRLIGEGGFAAVYLGEDTAAGGRCAIKVMGPTHPVGSKVLQRFYQEVRMVRTLNHPNVVKIWDVGKTQAGCPYYVMEYADGESLIELINREGPLEYERAGRIITQVLTALIEAHEHGIIHRDLKPGNILVTQPRGQADFVKVIDFGIAKALNQSIAMVFTERGDRPLLTPAFAAPEQILGSPVMPATDMYAVGMILATMLGGTPPLADGDVNDLVRFIKSPEPISLLALVTDTPFGAVVERAIAKKMNERWQSARQMLDAVEAAQQAAGVGQALRPQRTPHPASHSQESPAENLSIIVDVPSKELSQPGFVLHKSEASGPLDGPTLEQPSETSEGGGGQRILVVMVVLILALSGVVLALTLDSPTTAHNDPVLVVAESGDSEVDDAFDQAYFLFAEDPRASANAYNELAIEMRGTEFASIALFNSAHGYEQASLFVEACSALDSLINNYPRSDLVDAARRRLGLIQPAELAPASAGVDEAQLNAELAAAVPDLEECYRSALWDDPESSGAFTFEFRLTPNGDISEVWVTQASLAEGGESCIVEVVEGWQISALPSTGPVMIRKPVAFGSR